MTFKGQSDIIAAIIVVVIAIGLLSVAFTFGFPYIQKNQDKALDERVQAFFDIANSNSLPAKMKSVANNGGKDVIKLDVAGVMKLEPATNSMSFSFQSRVASKAVGKVVSLTGDACPPANGIIGVNDPVVVCVETYLTDGGFYNVTYRMYARELEDAQQKNGFKINMLQHESGTQMVSGSSPTVRIEFFERTPTVAGSKNLVNTDIKILLV